MREWQTITANDVAEYLESIDCISQVRPIEVTIGNETWQGASYRQDKDSRERLYLVGILPKCKKRRPKSTCFIHDNQEWYVAAYLQNNISEDKHHYHLCNRNFLIFPWDLDGPIDQYEQYNYQRVPMTVIYKG